MTQAASGNNPLQTYFNTAFNTLNNVSKATKTNEQTKTNRQQELKKIPQELRKQLFETIKNVNNPDKNISEEDTQKINHLSTTALFTKDTSQPLSILTRISKALKNTFLGRVSSKKLEQALNDYDNKEIKKTSEKPLIDMEKEIKSLNQQINALNAKNEESTKKMNDNYKLAFDRQQYLDARGLKPDDELKGYEQKARSAKSALRNGNKILDTMIQERNKKLEEFSDAVRTEIANKTPIYP